MSGCGGSYKADNMRANDRQVGGAHYKETAAPCPHCNKSLEHWDISWMFKFNQFQYCISKYIWRKKGPEGRPLLDDLEKAKHHLEKYIECVQHDENLACYEPEPPGEEGGATPDYVDQD